MELPVSVFMDFAIVMCMHCISLFPFSVSSMTKRWHPDREFVQQVVAQIPWGHNIVLLDKVADMDERKWYIKKSAENGWSRNVLVHQIESNLYQR